MIVLDDGQAATFVDFAAALQQALLAHAAEVDTPADAARWVHREATAANDLAVPISTPVPIASGPRLTVHDEAWEVTHEGRALSLTVLQYRLLRQLVTTWGRTVPLPRLAEAMFGAPFADQQRVIAHVKRLRRRLIEQGVCGCRIETVRGIGFRMVELVEGTSPVPAVDDVRTPLATRR